MTDYEIKCKHCKRFLGTTNKSIEITLKCSSSKCKKMETYKIVFLSEYTPKAIIKKENNDG